MIGQVADCLESAGLTFTIREIEDIVWLASLMDASAQGVRALAAPELGASMPEPQAGDSADDEGGVADLPRATEPPVEVPDPPTERLRLFGSTTGTVSGTTLRVPGVAGTSAPEQFRRALQPFARRVPSRRAMQLDEDATAAYAAETGIWMPQFEPVRERCFDLSFVIEDCTSAELRKQALDELADIFQRYSGLRSVSCYRLGGTGALTLRTLEGGAELGVEHLGRSDRRHLVLFATDGASPRWRDGSVQTFLSALGSTTSVSLLHLLPRPAWRYTLTGEPDVELHASLPGEPNRHLQAALPWWIGAGSGKDAMPLPVLGLNAAAAGVWARGISARGGMSMPGILVTPPAAAIPATAPPDQSDLSAARQVARYRNMVSGPAYQLAVFVSRIDPLTVPIMRLVQRTMLPNSGDGELAEFILGGLVTSLPASGPADGERLYRFREGVGAELLRSLRYSEEEKIDRQLRLVGQFLESSADRTRSFDVRFPDPDGTHNLSSWALPFAEVSRSVLRQLGAPARIGGAAEAPGRAAARDRLRLLHLTDLQIRHAGSEERDELGAAWTELLASMTAGGPIDLVCVSGDLTWGGSEAEFAEVGRFLDATLEVLGLPKDRLYVVPGNHDVHRLADPQPLELLSLMAPVSHAGITEYAAEHADLIARPQAAYRSWVAARLRHQAMQGVFADYHVTLEGWRVPVRIAGLDTSWLAAVSGFTPALAADQLNRLKEQAQEGPLIVLMHHAPDYLKDGGEVVKQLGAAGAKLVLHGHHYEQNGVAWRMYAGTGMIESRGAGMSPRLHTPGRVHLIDLDLSPGRACTVRQFSTFAWSAATWRWQAEQTDYWDENGALHAKPDAQHGRPATAAPEPELFVGRQAEMEQLKAVLTTPARESGRAAGRFLLTGPAGVGKTALADAYGRAWGQSHAQKRSPVVMRLHPDDRPELQLMTSLGAPSPADAVSRMRNSASLLVIDGVDTVDLFDAARELARQLPQCPILVAGRVPASGIQIETLFEPDWTILVLGGLSEDDSAKVLHNERPALVVPPPQLRKIVDAFWGNPALLQGAARHLAEPRFASQLIQWLGAGEAGPGSGPAVEANAFGFGLLLEHAFDYRLNEWLQRGLRHRSWLDDLLTMAYGPAGGAPSSLAAALAGVPMQGASKSARLGFADLCREAAWVGLLNDAGIVNMSAMGIYLLRRHATPAHRVAAHERWSEWIVRHLKAQGAARQPAWEQLHASGAALREWLDVCSLDAGLQARPHLLAYARSHGPLPAWRSFCRRMLDLLPAGAASELDWYYTTAQLATMGSDFPAALDALDRCERLRGRIPGSKPAVSLAALRALRTEILSKQGQETETSASRAGAQDQEPKGSVALQSQLRPYQLDLVRAAMQATKHGSEPIGTVVQARQTGMSMTLLAYLAACQQDIPGQLSYIVVVDMIVMGRQIAHRYREWQGHTSMLPLVEPESVEELQDALRADTPQVIVTTVQKLRLIQHAFNSECVIIYFGLNGSALKRLDAAPRGRRIVFSYDDFLFRPFSPENVGSVIAAYRREDAVRDGYLSPVTVHSIDFPNADARGRELPVEAVSHFVGEIRKDLDRALNLAFRAVVLVDDLAMVSGLRARLRSEAMGTPVKVIIAYPRTDWLPRALARFDKSRDEAALLIITPRSARSLLLDQIHCCYVLAKVSPSVQLILESFVNRPAPGRGPGQIVDYANNDWSVLGISAPLTEDVPAKPA